MHGNGLKRKRDLLINEIEIEKRFNFYARHKNWNQIALGILDGSPGEIRIQELSPVGGSLLLGSKARNSMSLISSCLSATLGGRIIDPSSTGLLRASRALFFLQTIFFKFLILVISL
ncbi:hypothetical protein AC481_01900 [miscellaneous Crenarchaeota group archaeon SMTZ-80]|nr:MAG: hypothetical protein AC481_01900 [miscellaneous Crenarchaeota group archaeon SMTZ-80]